MKTVARTLAAIALASVAASQADAAMSLNSEGRVLIQVNNPDTHAQVVADVVGDIWQEHPFLAWARPTDLPVLAKNGVKWHERVDVDFGQGGIDRLRSVGALPNADGSILDVNGSIQQPMSASELETMLVNAVRTPTTTFEDDAWYNLFHRYNEIILKAKAYCLSAPEALNCEYDETLSYSFEGRRLPGMEFGGRLNEGRENPKYVFVEANVHAREWLSGHGTLWAVREMMKRYLAGEEVMTELLDNIRVIYVPIANPDGYEYTWAFDRFWRKNRRVHTDIAGTGLTVSPLGLRVVCPAGAVGTDMNRNWDDHWNMGGSSPDPCSDVYMGPHAFSESEFKGIVKLLEQRKAEGADFLAGFDMHTYSALLLRPVGWGAIPNTECPVNQQWLIRQGAQMQQNILDLPEGVYYKNQAGTDLYVHSGAAADWFYYQLTDGRCGYTPELRPSEDSLIAAGLLAGFAPPPTDIVPGGAEALAMIETAMQGSMEYIRGNEPRIVTDEEYLWYFDEEFTDDAPAPDRCFDAKPKPDNFGQEDSDGDSEGSEVEGNVMAADSDSEMSSANGVRVHTMAVGAAVFSVAAYLF